MKLTPTVLRKFVREYSNAILLIGDGDHIHVLRRYRKTYRPSVISPTQDHFTLERRYPAFMLDVVAGQLVRCGQRVAVLSRGPMEVGAR